MRLSYTRRLPAVLFGAMAILTASLGGPASAQTLGQKYHTREPRTCPNLKNPTQGAPTAALAAQYVVCAQEREAGYNLYLVTGMSVEVGGGTPYTQLSLGARPNDGDPGGMVYAIRGAYKSYQCSVPSAYTLAGKQCTLYDQSKATGTCYRTQFHDWYCNMIDLNGMRGKPEQPPPSGF